MKRQFEVISIGRNVVCRECSKPTRTRKSKYYHPECDIHIVHGKNDGKHFNYNARQAILRELQRHGISVKTLTYEKPPYNPKPKHKRRANEVLLF